MPDDLQPSPSPGLPDYAPDVFDRCPHCHRLARAAHAPGCPGKTVAPLSIRLTVEEYDRLCLIAVREEIDVTKVVRRAVRVMLARTPVPPRRAS